MAFDQREYVAQYQKENIVRVLLKLSKKYDADIIEALEKSGNKQGYIKELIRKDIASRE